MGRRRERCDADPGWIYIISNPAWDGWHKVGKSINLPGRLQKYQTGTPFRDYKIIYSKYIRNVGRVEHEIGCAFKHRCEWYQVDEKVLITFIENIPDMYALEPPGPLKYVIR